MPQPFPRSLVRLLEGPIGDRAALTGQYLLQLQPDRLLRNFRINAGLPSSAQPLGGWESPACGLRGHFTGHYLSACAKMFASTGDERFRARAVAIVEGLVQCQAALGGNYLSAFPEAQFDILEREFSGVWAPYYTLHKILAGLLDAHRDAADPVALRAASRLGDWVAVRTARLPNDILEPMLRTSKPNPQNEYGGIGEALYDLYDLTESAEYFDAARRFDRDWFLTPLIESRDVLSGLHANAHIPQALAAARRYEMTGEEPYRKAALYFWERTALARSYANGGSSGPRPDRCEHSEGGEHWPEANRLAGTLTPKINESCVVHNMLKLTDILFSWEADPRYADFRERAYFNSVLAMQHPGHPGAYVYSHPLAHGSRKVFGDFDATFWCCYGTTVEAYSSLADGIYFQDGQQLWINQFVASEATWPQRGVRIVQQTTFPQEAATRLTFHLREPIRFTLRIRIPTWASGAKWQIGRGNDCPSAAIENGYLVLRRTWRDGDTLELSLPMSLRTEALNGDDHRIAFMYGPTLLAARTPHALELGVPMSVACRSVTLRQHGPRPHTARLGFGGEVDLVPVNEIVEEAFGVYFTTVPE